MSEAVVPLNFIERLERAQLEILAIALYGAENYPTPWRETLAAFRESYRTYAHELMQGREPSHWRGRQPSSGEPS